MTKLWLIRQTKNLGYDTYNSAVVAAPNAELASLYHPSEYNKYSYSLDGWVYTLVDGRVIRSSDSSWVHPRDVIVVYLGETDREISGVVLASFNAG